MMQIPMILMMNPIANWMILQTMTMIMMIMTMERDYHNAEENKANMPVDDNNTIPIPNSIANNLGPFWSSPTSSR